MSLQVCEPTEQLLALTVTSDDRCTRISAAGEVDTCTAPRLAAALDSALADGARAVAVDLDAVTFLGCAAVRTLAAADRRATTHGVRVHMTPPRPAVLRTLQLGGLWRWGGTGQPSGRPQQAA